jgi:hypothetical protein
MPFPVIGLVVSFVVSMVMGILLRPKPRGPLPQDPSGWQYQTFQRETDIEYSFGIVPVVGNAVGPWTEASNTLRVVNPLYHVFWALDEDAGDWNKTVISHHHEINFALVWGDGPVVGLSPGATLNDRPLADWEDLVSTERMGTDDQASWGIEDRFESGMELEVPVGAGNAISVEMTDSDYVDCGIIIGSMDGLIGLDKSGHPEPERIQAKIEIRIIDGAWHTLFEYNLIATLASPVRWLFLASGTYEGGTPFSITPGDRHEWRVTCISVPTGRGVGKLKILGTQQLYGETYRHPGLAGIAISAFAMDAMPAGLDFKGLLQAKLVEDCGRTTIAWGRNPAAVAFAVITDPVIKGNGGGTAFSVDYYRGSQPAEVREAEFIAAETWCNTPRPNGKGVDEPQFEFDGTFTSKSERWEQAMNAAKNHRLNLWHDGAQWRCWIDQTRAASHVFCDANIKFGCEEEGIDNRASPGKILSEIKNRDSGYVQGKIGWTDPLATAEEADRALTIDGFGISRVSHFIRIARYLRDRARYIDRTYTWGSGPGGLDAEIGQVAYLQHDTLGNGYGAKIAEVLETDTVVVDVDLPALEGGVTYKMVIQTLDAVGGKHVTVYTVDELLDANTVVLTEELAYTPVAGDICIVSKEIDLRQVTITGTNPDETGRCRFTGEIYNAETYARDDDAPDFNTVVHLAAAAGSRTLYRPLSRQDLLTIYPQDRVLSGDDVDQVLAGGIVFAAAGGGAVGWTCTGENDLGWVRLGGVSYPIQMGGGVVLDSEGNIITDSDGGAVLDEYANSTTDEFIYFDRGAVDPTLLQTTSDASLLRGQSGRVPLCRNIAGVPHIMTGGRIGTDTGDLYPEAVTAPAGSVNEVIFFIGDETGTEIHREDDFVTMGHEVEIDWGACLYSWFASGDGAVVSLALQCDGVTIATIPGIPTTTTGTDNRQFKKSRHTPAAGSHDYTIVATIAVTTPQLYANATERTLWLREIKR